MQPSDLFDSDLDEHAQVLKDTRERLRDDFIALVALCEKSVRDGGKLMFFGNGGSASDAQHLATELTVRFRTNRKAIAAVALTTDTSALTAIGNDLGFERLFSRQIEALGRSGDVAIALSTSGRSPNVIEAARQAKKQGISVAALTGGDGGELRNHADPALIVPSTPVARIQEMHITLGQMMCSALEQRLGLA
jgi:D-sedoheptulose 7-phosphate isomerase